MANAVYGKARELFLNGDLDWANDNIKAVLVDTAAYEVSIDTDDYLSDIPVGDRIATSGNLSDKTSTLGAGCTNIGLFNLSISGTVSGDASSLAQIRYLNCRVDGSRVDSYADAT